MGLFESERPDFESMTKEELIKILDKFRKSLKGVEDPGDFCLYAGDVLGVSCETNYYEEE